MKNLFLFLFFAIHCLGVVAQSNLEIESSIDNIFKTYENKPGCAFAVVKEGQVIFQKGYGLANLEHGIPVTTKTVFEVGSNAQQFTAACIFLLEQEGKLRLDDPIQKYLPEIPTYETGPITISNLLYHTSGLRSFFATLHSKNKYWGDSYDNRDALKTIARHKGVNFPSGSKHYFSNANYALLASIVERASGQSIGKYAHEKLFEPLGMSNTFYKEKRDTVIKSIATGYEPEGDYFNKNHNYNSTVVGCNGLNTTVEDFAKWSTNLKTGTVGGQRFVERMTTPGTLKNGQATECTSGLFVNTHYGIDELPALAHIGGWAGFRSLFYKFMKQDLAFIFLSNNANTNAWILLDGVVPLFLEEELAKVQQARRTSNSETALKTTTFSKEEEERFCGTYYNTIDGHLRNIVLEGEQLVYQRVGAHSTPLQVISSNELIFQGAPFVRLKFTSGHKTMAITINEQTPIIHEKYEKMTYTEDALKEFENSYYNEDIDEHFKLIALDGELQVMVSDRELTRMTPFMKDGFRVDHFGYFKFRRDSETGKIIGFIRNDDHLYNLEFNVADKPKF